MSDWISPTEEWPLSQGFRPPSNPGHEGVDIAVWVGTLIVAPHDGVVVTAGLTDPYGYGNLIIVDEGAGFYTRYGHMSVLWVDYGQWVAQGQPLGLSGGLAGAYGAGNSGGPHLHYETRPGDVPIDPVPFLHPWAPPVPPAPPPSPPKKKEPPMDQWPSAALNGHTLVVVRGFDGFTYGAHRDAQGKWGGFQALGDPITSWPQVVSDGTRIQILMRGHDQALWARDWTPAGGFGPTYQVAPGPVPNIFELTG